jgi:putative nucleotidyltransferase with HDIG domain
MSETNYRLVFNGAASGADIKKLLIFFQKDLGLTHEKIQKLMISAPRIIQDFSNRHGAELIQAALAKIGGMTAVEPVITYPSVPFSLSQRHEKLIKKELSKILRCRSSLLLLYLQVGSDNPQLKIPSMMSAFGEEVADYFRESDTVIPVDDTRLLILAFATDKLGIVPLQNKIQRLMKKLLAGADIINSGYAVFPDESQTLEKLLQLAARPRDIQTGGDIKDEAADLPTTPSAPSQPAENGQETMNPFLICFQEAKGRIFKRLLTMDPQTLWIGLSAIPQAQQKDFMFRLPFDAPLASMLEELINFHPKRVTDKFIENHFKAIIIQMKLEKDSLERRQMLDEVQYKLNHSDDLPTLPAIANQIFQIASNPSTSGKELTHIVMRDPALTSKLLKTVNSAFFGHPQKISSVAQAIILLGTDDIVDIAFGLAAAKIFDVKPIKGFIDPDHLWHHAISTALIAQNLCKNISEYSDLAFTAGLLHDVGKIFLIAKFADMYLKAFSNNADYNLPLFELEEDIFGTNHAILGKELSSRWNLPEALVHAISYHHQPFSAPSHSGLAAIVGLADYLYYKALESRMPPDGEPAQTNWLTAGHWIFLNRFFDNMGQEKLNQFTQDAAVIIENNQDHLTLPR